MQGNDSRTLSPTYEDIFNWRHLKDQQLYRHNDYAVKTLSEGIDLSEDGFDYKIQAGSKTAYHCYWYGETGRKQVFSIKSFLCTQDLNKCKVILWLDIQNGFENYRQNPFLKIILPFIEVRAYDPILEAKDTLWENHLELPNEQRDLVKRCDAFRFLILYKYGGVYFDLDVMFLKNLGGLLNSEFCYAWETQPYANSAILNLKCKSDICMYLLQKSIVRGAASPWGIFIYSDPLLKDLYILPCAFFDPIWQVPAPEESPFDNFSKFFKQFDGEFTNEFNIYSYKKFFPGCYAYHWHNQWKTTEYENSFFGIFEKEFNELLGLD